MKKLIVTSLPALDRKYGREGRDRIVEAVDALARADAKRGITTTLVSPAKPPPGVRGWKKAIDAAYVKAGRPDYVVILGAPDVVPHQILENPTDDEDTSGVPSDLPYACDAPYSKQIKDFIGPTRVVSRLPDDHRGDDPQPLLTLLARATLGAMPVGAPRLFVLSAADWEQPSREVAHRCGAPMATLRLSPDDFAPIPIGPLDVGLHLINCHGAPETASFYGDGGSGAEDVPAVSAGDVLGGVVAGSVAAFECCYGADIYPRIDVGRGIAETYLQEGAGAVFASTTIAYGATDDRQILAADVICASFLRQVRDGASVGRAVLEARLAFVKTESPLADVELKTLAQFVLLGDPAHRPFPKNAPKTGGPTPKAKSKAAPKTKPASGQVAAHAAHRQMLRETGDAQSTWATGQEVRSERAEPPSELREVARTMGLSAAMSTTETVWTSATPPESTKSGAPKSGSKSAGSSKHATTARVWTLTDAQAPPPPAVAVVESTDVVAVATGGELRVAVAKGRRVARKSSERTARRPQRITGVLAKEVDGAMTVRRFVSHGGPR